MLTIEIKFTAGHYHATPWGRSVNEADVEWPPSPWRLLRTLLALHHRKTPDLPQAEIHELLHRLAQELPSYALPPAVHSHTRHYLPQRELGKTSLVFDAFLAIDSDAPLHIHWPSLTLSREEEKTLSRLLEVMSYFGRAESWAEATLTNTVPTLNCWPNGETVDAETGEVTGEPVRVLAPPTAVEYNNWIAENREPMLARLKGKKREQLAYIMPDTLAEALDRDTADWLIVDKAPPAFSRWRHYTRPQLNTLRPAAIKPSLPKVDIARFALTGKPQLRLRDTLKQAEWFRTALISKAKEHPMLSGHDLPPDNRHAHAFYFPEDRDGDGLIDHLLLHVPGGIDGTGQQAIQNLKQLWDYKGNRLNVALLDIGRAEQWAANPISMHELAAQACSWVSATPWYCPWYMKPKRELQSEVQRYIAKECAARNIPIPTVELLSEQSLREGGKSVEMHRFRYRRDRKSPPPNGKGLLLKLNFVEPFSGPLALGYGCHFGLGMFKPFV